MDPAGRVLIDNLLTLAGEGPGAALPARGGSTSAPSREGGGGCAGRPRRGSAAARLAPTRRLGRRVSRWRPPTTSGSVLDNLIENALDYAGPGPRVTIAWRLEDGAARIAVARSSAPGSRRARNGPRWSASRPRQCRRPARSGTGLGLAIVDSLVRRWQGRAALANLLEGGLRAEVRFPAAATVTEESWVEPS